jgi:O-antigen ligase
VSAAALATVIDGRFRKPDAVLGWAVAFAVWGGLSLLWTVSYDNTLIRAMTYAQLVVSVWVIREFVRTRDDVQLLLTALCLGTFVPLTGLLANFMSGIEIGRGAGRFSGGGLNADALGLLAVLGLPMAWLLIVQRRGIVRILALVYFTLTPIALLLTATRGAILAGFVALAIIPLTFSRRAVKWYVLAGLFLAIGTIYAAMVVPQSNWDRILSTEAELTEGGEMSGRTAIWQAGFQVYPDHAILGVGAGAYAAATGPYLRNTKGPMPSHNVAIGLLVEEGIVGLCLFGAILGACAWTIAHLPAPYRALWSVLMLTWLVAAMSVNWEHVKVTWVLFGLIAAQSGLTSRVGQAWAADRVRTPTMPLRRLARASQQSPTPARDSI